MTFVSPDNPYFDPTIPAFSSTTKEIIPAYIRAWHEFPTVSKNADNPHFNSKFADLEGLLNTVKPILKTHGLAPLQRSRECDGGSLIITTLIHTSGEWISDGGLYLPAPRDNPQGFGSAITYNKRYALTLFLGLATADDDGNSATDAIVKAKPKRAAKKTATPAAPTGPVSFAFAGGSDA